MQEIILIFFLGCIGTAIRSYLSAYGKYHLLLANIIGVCLAAISFNNDLSLLLTGFCGSITTLSTLVKIGYDDKKYYVLTILINLTLFYILVSS